MCSVNSPCETSRPRWCIRYERTRNSWLVSLTGVPLRVTRAARGSSVTSPDAEFRRKLSAGSADERSQTREHLFHPKWLRDVVVRAAVNALHLLVPAAAGGQKQHRHDQAVVPPSLQHGESVDAGEPKVEDHRVVLFRPAEKVGALAVGGAIHRVASLPKGGGQLARQAHFILDDENPHQTVIAQPNLNGT